MELALEPFARLAPAGLTREGDHIVFGWSAAGLCADGGAPTQGARAPR